MEKMPMCLLAFLMIAGCMGSEVGQNTAPGLPPLPSTSTSTTADTKLPDASQPANITAHAGARDLTLFIAGCDEDDYNNTMVAGYVTNRGNGSSGQFYLAVQLQDETGTMVAGGMRLIEKESLGPGESSRFTAVFENPPTWRRCAARPLIE
ncbi:MAG: FxLYD domain-containing protein [Candidatus Altiarchaeota archaeon]